MFQNFRKENAIQMNALIDRVTRSKPQQTGTVQALSMSGMYSDIYGVYCYIHVRNVMYLCTCTGYMYS